MRIPFGHKEEVRPHPQPTLELGPKEEIREKFRLQPTFEEVAEYAKIHRLHSSTEKLREAYRLCRIDRLKMGLAQGVPLQQIIREIIDLL